MKKWLKRTLILSSLSSGIIIGSISTNLINSSKLKKVDGDIFSNFVSTNNSNTTSSFLGNKYLVNDSLLNEWLLMNPSATSSSQAPKFKNLNSTSTSSFSNNYNLAPMGLNNMYSYYTWFYNIFGYNLNSIYQTTPSQTDSNSDTQYIQNIANLQLNYNLLNELLNNHFLITNPSVNAVNSNTGGSGSMVFAKNGNNTPTLDIQVNPMMINGLYNMSVVYQTMMSVFNDVIQPSGAYQTGISDTTSNNLGSYGFPQFGSYNSLYDGNSSTSLATTPKKTPSDASDSSSINSSLISTNIVLANINYLAMLCLTGAISNVAGSSLTPAQQFNLIISSTKGLVPSDNDDLAQILSSGPNGNANLNSMYFCPSSYVETMSDMPIYVPVSVSLAKLFENLPDSMSVNQSSLSSKQNYPVYFYVALPIYLNVIFNWLNKTTINTINNSSSSIFSQLSSLLLKSYSGNYYYYQNSDYQSNFENNISNFLSMQKQVGIDNTATNYVTDLKKADNSNIFVNYTNSANFIQDNSYYTFQVGNTSYTLTTPTWFNNVLNYGITPISWSIISEMNIFALTCVFNFSYVTQTTALLQSDLANTNEANTYYFFALNLGQLITNPQATQTTIEDVFNTSTGAVTDIFDESYYQTISNNNLMESLSINYSYWIYDANQSDSSKTIYTAPTTIPVLNPYEEKQLNWSSIKIDSSLAYPCLLSPNSIESLIVPSSTLYDSGAVTISSTAKNGVTYYQSNWNQGSYSTGISNILGTSQWNILNPNSSYVNLNALQFYFPNQFDNTASVNGYFGIDTSLINASFKQAVQSLDESGNQLVIYNYDNLSQLNGKNTLSVKLNNEWWNWQSSSVLETSSSSTIWQNVVSDLNSNDNNFINVTYSNWSQFENIIDDESYQNFLPSNYITFENMYDYQANNQLLTNTILNSYNTNDISTFSSSILNASYSSLNNVSSSGITYNTYLISVLTTPLQTLLNSIISQKSRNVSALNEIAGYNFSSSGNISQAILNNNADGTAEQNYIDENSVSPASNYFYNVSSIFNTRWITKNHTLVQSIDKVGTYNLNWNLTNLMQTAVSLNTINSLNNLSSYQLSQLMNYFNTNSLANVLTTNSANGIYVGMLNYTCFDYISDGELVSPQTTFYLYNLPYTASASINNGFNNTQAISINKNVINLNIEDISSLSPLANTISNVIVNHKALQNGIETDESVTNSVIKSIMEELINNNVITANYGNNLAQLIQDGLFSTSITNITNSSITFTLNLPTITFPTTSYTASSLTPITIDLTGFLNPSSTGTISSKSVIQNNINQHNQQISQSAFLKDNAWKIEVGVLVPTGIVVLVAVSWLLYRRYGKKFKDWVHLKNKKII